MPVIDLTLHCDRIPESLARELEAYVNDRCPVCYSTDRLLSNDLLGAVFALDDEGLAALKPICQLIACELPWQCHGSERRVNEWLNRKDNQ
jgi:hypothetical protein